MSRRWLVFAVSALLAGCTEGADEDSPPEDFSPPAQADTVGGEARDLEAELPILLTSTIARSRDDAGQGIGTVRLLQSGEAEGSLTLTIELNDAEPGAHAWEIREEDCAASTDSAGTSPGSRTAGITGSVNVSEAGFGEASALVPTTALEAKDVGRSRYSLVVHGLQTAGSASGVVGCADL